MVLEYKKLSQSFKEFKAEEESCATSVELAGSTAMQAALSKLENENDELKNRTEEILCENWRLADIISSWTKYSASLQKLQGATKQSGDKTGLGYYRNESSTSETSNNQRLGGTKFKTMNFVKSALNHLLVEIKQQRKFNSNANSAATQIQQLAIQRRKFSSWNLATQHSAVGHLATRIQQLSDADFIVSTKLHNSDFSTQIQILDAGNFTREIMRELSREQARFHAVTAKLSFWSHLRSLLLLSQLLTAPTTD
ncbi:phragmoplast orienting kinesin 2 [Dorcoceras hygrometricum]|uniref:Phragmoplast orienting kinesin 2 n=1 Tax=Dorcoceras hygrometricum TaxID=472368 RepID=A0A2Z7AVX5_9LAMI|nr:phragmoplast orienting kinesin 2 [Dorcoceras hygrometricum]